MKTNQHRAVELPASPPSRRAGRCRCAALVAALAVLTLSTTAAVATPTFDTATVSAETRAFPGIVTTLAPYHLFDNEGTNARFTLVTFSTLAYYDESSTGLLGTGNSHGQFLFVKAKTNAQLNAMDSPPPNNPFTVTANVTMTNDEGETASGTASFITPWTEAEPPPGPTLTTTTENLPAGTTASAFADGFFDNAGTNPRFTAASFSTLDYYDADRSGVSGGFLDVTAKTSAELDAMSTPPSNPFTVQVTVTMTNNEGQTATGTVDYVTRW